MAMTALDGVRILDLTWGMAGPAGILLLAEHGADVVKVEPPGGDPYREYPGYRVWNRSRRSVAIDLKSEEGKERFVELIGTADVLAESFSPGVMARLGLDYDALAARFPHLIYCSVPAYPADSRHAGRPGWDALVQARSGQQFEQQAWRPGPAFLASPLPSIAASYLVPTAILAALHAAGRDRAGSAGRDVPLPGCSGVHDDAVGQRRARAGHVPVDDDQDLPACGPPARGHHDRGRVDPVVGRCDPEEGGIDQRDFGLPMDLPPENLYAEMQRIYKDRKREELLELLHDELFQAAELIPTRETLRLPQVLFNEMAVQVDDPEVGPTVQVGMPFKLTRNPALTPRPRPAVGQHNAEVFAETRQAPEVTPRSPSTVHRFPLDGIRVLDFGRAFAGPYGPMLLAGLGADVIKVATPEFDPGSERMATSSVLLGCEQGKRSLLVDLKTPEGAERGPQAGRTGRHRAPQHGQGCCRAARDRLREPPPDQARHHLLQHLHVRARGPAVAPWRERLALPGAQRVRVGTGSGRGGQRPVVLPLRPHRHHQRHGVGGRRAPRPGPP